MAKKSWWNIIHPRQFYRCITLEGSISKRRHQTLGCARREAAVKARVLNEPVFVVHVIGVALPQPVEAEGATPEVIMHYYDTVLHDPNAVPVKDTEDNKDPTSICLDE